MVFYYYYYYLSKSSAVPKAVNWEFYLRRVFLNKQRYAKKLRWQRVLLFVLLD